MPGEGTQVLNVIHNIEPNEPRGLNVIWETTNQNINPLASWFQTVTGSTQGSSILADVTYNQSANTSIKAIQSCPKNCRPYVTFAKWQINGATSWTSGNAVILQDSNGNPVYYIPLVALQGLARGCTGVPELASPQTATVVSYVASTGVATFAAGTFTTTRFANTMATVIGGTGAGQSFIIASNTATTLTMVTPTPIALDNTSVVAVWYHAATAATGTTITDAKAAFPTTLDLSNGYYVVIVSGTGAGQTRAITSNTATQLTVATWTTTPDNTSNFYVTNNPEGMGAIDQTSGMFNTLSTNAGLQVAVNGTMGAGSPIRFLVEGFWAY